jgi:two-component system response regulator HydG
VARVLVVDDETAIRHALERILGAMGFDVVSASDGVEAQELIAQSAFDLVVTDLSMPRADGFDVLRAVRELRAGVPAIVLTAHSSTTECVRAMRAGAADFIGKPFEQRELERAVRAALRHAGGKSQAPMIPESHWPLAALVGDSPAVRSAIEQVERAAESDVAVLLVGERDTGKHAIARLLHSMSRRAGKALITFRCSSFLPEQIEHELLGDDRAGGWLSLAEGGTLLLTELELLDAALRERLARDVVQRIAHGGRANVRVLISIDVDAHNEAETTELASTLQGMLDGVMIAMPALRERPQDLPLLVEHFTQVANRRLGRNVSGVNIGTALSQYAWPGNLSELEERVVRYVTEAPPELQELPPMVNAFVVPVQRVRVELILDDGSRHQALLPRGPGQPIEELFEARESFVPVRQGETTRIYARASIACVIVPDADEPEDDGLPRKVRAVRVTLHSGAVLDGELRYVPVEGRARVTDVLNEFTPSFPLYAGAGVHHIAKAHVRYVEES